MDPNDFIVGPSVISVACMPIVFNPNDFPLVANTATTLAKAEVLTAPPGESSSFLNHLPVPSQTSVPAVVPKIEGNVNFIEEPLFSLVHQSSTTLIKTENSSQCSFLCNHCGEVFADLSLFAQHVCILTGDRALTTPGDITLNDDLFDSRPSSGETTSILQVDHIMLPDRKDTPEPTGSVVDEPLPPPADASASTTPAHDRPFVCTICDKSYTTASGLLIHERRHAGERPYLCRFCTKSFPDSSSCARHERIHTGERPYVCEHCGRAFNDSSHLVTHRRKHTGERPYPCTECAKAFFKSSDLKRHLRTHMSERPLACRLCDKKFKEPGALAKHQRTHSNVRPFECADCDKAFFDRSSYLRHRRIHSGERTWTCDVCGKGFFDSTNLKRHARTHLTTELALPEPVS